MSNELLHLDLDLTPHTSPTPTLLDTVESTPGSTPAPPPTT